jgi:hypothetical protein
MARSRKLSDLFGAKQIIGSLRLVYSHAHINTASPDTIQGTGMKCVQTTVSWALRQRPPVLLSKHNPISHGSIQVGGETLTLRGSLPPAACVRLKERSAEGKWERIGLLRCRTPLSICRLKYLVAGAAAVIC